MSTTTKYELEPDRSFGRALLSAHLVAPAGPLVAGELVPIDLLLHRYDAAPIESASLEIINREHWSTEDSEEYHPITSCTFAVPVVQEASFKLRVSLDVQAPPDSVTSFHSSCGRVETAFELTVKCVDSKETKFTALVPVRGKTDWTSPSLQGKPRAQSDEHFELELADGICWPGGLLVGRVKIKPTPRAGRATRLLLEGVTLGGDEVRFRRELPGPFTSGLDYPFRLQIPEDALPSYVGKNAKVDWLLRVSLDVPFAIDPTTGLRFKVVPTAPE